MDENQLYSEIEKAIIRWSNDGTLTAGTLTREIMDLLTKKNSQVHDSDFMYKWITKHSGRGTK